MHRTDRLYDLLELLRDGRLHRATDLADRLGVSGRTIWRDMATLMAGGLPVEGERGMGYVLRVPTTLPALMLHPGELDALRLGLQMVARSDDVSMARAARSLATKVAAAAPAPASPGMTDTAFTPEPARQSRAMAHLPLIRTAIRAHERLAISYIDPMGHESHRDIRPLKLERQGRIRTLTAWCEARRDFRSFRIDRILTLTPTGEVFPDEPGRRWDDWKASQAKEITL